jgi:predicted transcriptional regulator
MRQIQQHSNSLLFKEIVGQKINHHLIGLDKAKKDDSQNILELCHVGKMLATYFNDYEISEVMEKPDFIISNGHHKIGLEHEQILCGELKSSEGYYENICKKVQQLLEQDENLPNFLVNVYIKKNVTTRIKDKGRIIETIHSIIKDFVNTNVLKENEFIDKILIMKHSKKSVCPNFGAYCQNWITEELICEYVAKKEVKLNSYISNSVETQWLVLVIGSLGKSSYEVNKNMNIKLNTKFDKVYLYENFSNNLYEIK